MPEHNRFRHQMYAHPTDESRIDFLRPPQPNSGPPNMEEMLEISDCWHAAKVRAVLLVHGTFTGDDAFGLLREVERFAPVWGRLGRRRRKQWLDRLANDVGNYPPSFQGHFEELLNQRSKEERSPDQPNNARNIQVRRIEWSSENLHTARVNAAVELLDAIRLLKLEHADSSPTKFHVVMWGHSHAGNVFALVTNIIGGDQAARGQLFEVERLTRKRPKHEVDVNVQRMWRRVSGWLSEGGADNLELSIVTFGTPIRYGWETLGYQRLLHIIHHRQAPDVEQNAAKFPQAWDDLRHGRFGDSIQQLGIAGTDFWPYLFSWHRWTEEKRWRDLLQPEWRRSDVLRLLRRGVRVPDEGQCLLVDYPDDEEQTRMKLCGHGIYTTLRWLPIHLRWVTDSWFR